MYPVEGPARVRELDPVPNLVERAKQGDRDAYGQLYRLHHAAVFRFARFHLGIDAEDVVSEVFLRAWKALPRYRQTGVPFAAWLYGIARHVVSDESGRRSRTHPAADPPDPPVEFNEDDRMALAQAIAELPMEQRQVIELKFLVGLRNAEVASAMNTTIGAVNARQWRALASLRAYLSRDES